MNKYTPTIINTVVLIIYIIIGPWLDQNECFLLAALMALIQMYVIYSLSSDTKHNNRMNQLDEKEKTGHELLDYKFRIQLLNALEEVNDTPDKEEQIATIITTLSLLIKQQNEQTERSIQKNEKKE